MPQPWPPAAARAGRLNAIQAAPCLPPSPSPLAEQLRINWLFDIGGFLPGTIRSCLADGGRRSSLPARPDSRSLPTALPPNAPGAKSRS